MSRIHEIAETIIKQVSGSSTGIMGGVDQLIDEGLFTEEEFHDNELEILSIVDDSCFECVCCGWTLETSMLSDREFSELVCEDCEDEYV